jgi:hypothetical protein
MLEFFMPQLPIRSIVERALEKRENIHNFIAMPVLYEAKGEEASSRGDQLRESSVMTGLLGGEVAGVWHTPDSIEIVLKNGMQMSLETRPLTLAIKIRQDLKDDEQGPRLVTLISDHEGSTPTVASIESKLRNLRQIYAIAAIVYGGTEYESRLIEHLKRGGHRGSEVDFEAALSEDEQLLLYSAGQGSFWAVVGAAAVKLVKEGPRAAFVLVTTVLKGGQDRLVRYSDGTVRVKEAEADKAAADARSTLAKAEQDEISTVLSRSKISDSLRLSQLEVKQKEFEAEKDRQNHLLSMAERIDKVATPELKEILLEGFNSNLKPLLLQTLPALSSSQIEKK